MISRVLLVFLALFAAAMHAAPAQNKVGVITGMVVDSSGAPVEAAVVDLKAGWSGALLRQTVTGSDGHYELTSIPAGSDYSVSVRRPGFVTMGYPGITVKGSDRLRLDFRLRRTRALLDTVAITGRRPSGWRLQH